VVAALELAGALHGEHVLGLLHHADQRGVAAGVGAVAAALRGRDVPAHLAEPHALLDLLQHVLQPRHVRGIRGEQVERDPLRALGPDAGQPAELVDQVLDRALEQSNVLAI